jgi:hypothetical protein
MALRVSKTFVRSRLLVCSLRIDEADPGRPGGTGTGKPPAFVLCRRQKNPLNRRPAVAVENELVHPAESGRVLILLAYRLLENVDFSVASLLR